MHHFFYTGIYISAQKMKVDMDDCIDTCMNVYIFYKAGCPKNISKVIDKAYDMMDNNKDEASCLKMLLWGNPELTDQVVLYAKICLILENVKISQDLAIDVITYSKENHLDTRFEKDPYIAISNTMVKSLMTTRHELTLDDYATLAMHMGICSKLGNKAFVATTRVEICSRMFGCKSASELEVALQDPVLEALYKKFTTRRVFERLFAQVTERFHLREIGMKRHTYVSYRFPDDQSFVRAIAGADRTLQKKKRSAELKSLIAKEYKLDIPDAV